MGEPPGGFCDVGCCCCHSLLFNVIPHSSVSYRQVFTPILYFQPSSSQSDSRHFHFNFSGPFCYSFTASATVLTGRLLPTGVFLPMPLLPDIFDTTYFYQGLPGSQQFFLEVCRLHADPRNAEPVYQFDWVTTIHKRGIVVGSIYGLLLAGSVKHPLLTRFEPFSRQAGCVTNRMAYPFGHKAIQSVLI